MLSYPFIIITGYNGNAPASEEMDHFIGPAIITDQVAQTINGIGLLLF